MENLFYIIPVFGLVGLLIMGIRAVWVGKQTWGTEKMHGLARKIEAGAMAFLRAEWKVLAYFAVIVAVLLAFMGASGENSSWLIAVCFLAGDLQII